DQRDSDESSRIGYSGIDNREEDRETRSYYGSDELCRFWMKEGTVCYGVDDGSCKFRHPKICDCRRQECNKYHATKGNQCVKYLNGTCWEGRNCPFEHYERGVRGTEDRGRQRSRSRGRTMERRDNSQARATSRTSNSSRRASPSPRRQSKDWDRDSIRSISSEEVTEGQDNDWGTSLEWPKSENKKGTRQRSRSQSINKEEKTGEEVELSVRVREPASNLQIYGGRGDYGTSETLTDRDTETGQDIGHQMPGSDEYSPESPIFSSDSEDGADEAERKKRRDSLPAVKGRDRKEIEKIVDANIRGDLGMLQEEGAYSTCETENDTDKQSGKNGSDSDSESEIQRVKEQIEWEKRFDNLFGDVEK
ncbi:unnamed protein product, partial [Meganyctiphanes norvegica]